MQHAPSPPTLAQVARATAGFVALGAVGALGPHAGATAQIAPSGLLVHLGALALTGPTLLVAHPFLGLRASPDALVGALARAFTRAGDLALGLVPLLLFFAATTQVTGAVFAGLLLFVGSTALLGAARDLVAAEGRTADVTPRRLARMRALTVAWCMLTVLAAARVGFEVLS